MKFFDIPDVRDGESLDAFYKKLLNLVPDLIFKMVWMGGDNYSIVYASETVNEIYEMTVDEFKHNTNFFFTDRIVKEDIKSFIKSAKTARRKLTLWDHEFRVQLPQKGLRWIRVSAKPETDPEGTVSFYGRVTDITTQKDQESKIAHSEQRYEYALKAASEGLWDWDMVTNMVYYSPQLMKIMGAEEKEAYHPNTFWLSRIHPDDLKSYKNMRDAYLDNKSGSFEHIYRIMTDQGKYRWVLSRGRAIFDKKSRPLRAIGTLKDITQLKEKEVELGNTIDIIGDQNNRLSNFAHIVSHNLRSHAGNLKMLLDIFKNAADEEKEVLLQHLEGISDGLSITIGHLKQLVEIQNEIKIVREDLNLRHYLKHILTILHNEITKYGINIEINIPLDVTVNYNPAYLESILLNFTTNAIKYSSPDRSPLISYDFEIVDGIKILSVTDNGLGIDLKKHKNSLFGMYKTFHKHQNSRGIGLFITKNQVEAMGGKIEVSSEMNKGTTFKIYFDEES
ncbi:PAS domain-containing sensor histidine kinase [Flavobacterium sp. MFBS3-15]|uniref:PAS domain-containing sensor histidine kinase n=1 Tax=Flavobacterium sp. MFBS3-15 TaxID=2989816 RepID=UPI00223543DF|nr:PAS domain-containing sensor histidine kinase [Flavobacterium sp. MFBS3-15]MCW4470483.1 PAS domain-containing sensor histidine kinase [Flavobacterium sp. MFBS3-15]